MPRQTMRSQQQQQTQVTSQTTSRPRAAGDVTTEPTPGTPRGDLLALLRPVFVSLPPDSQLSNEMVAAMLADAPIATKQKMQQVFCTPPGPLYCEIEKTAWVALHPWCNATLIELTPPPMFTDEVTRAAWSALHPTCSAPPVLSDHVCTPGDPSCATPVVASTGNVGLFFAGVAALGIAWWMYESGKQARGNPYSGHGLDEFTRSYLATALWSETDDSGRPLEDKYDFSDFTLKAIEKAKKDTAKFQKDNAHLIAGNEYKAGRDFWLTRNGHGAGFWDGDWRPAAVGERLTQASKKFGETNVLVNRGKLDFYR